MSFNSRSFRDALGSFPTGVTVVTTNDDRGIPVGVTVSSFTSVSLAPPLVLFCLDKGNSAIAAFSGGSHFAINVLAADQEALSVRFSQKNGDRWAGLEVVKSASGVPVLQDCLASFDCASVARHDGGDHVIFVGEVLSFQQREGRPLVYHRGKYARLGAD